MTIKRGGGPAGPRVTPRQEPQRAASGRLESPKGAEEAQRAAAFEADGFDDEMSGPGVSRSASGDRAEDVLGRPEQRHSGVRSSERLLETTYDRLAGDYAQLQSEVHGLIAELASAGFSQAALADKAPDLRDKRARVGKLRARLSTIRRRLRSLALPAGSALELQLAQRLEGRIRAVGALEQGAERTLMALQLATTFRPRSADGRAAQITRIPAESGDDGHARGSALAQLAPDAATTGTMLRMLSGQRPVTKTPALSGSPDLEALRAFSVLQLGS